MQQKHTDNDQNAKQIHVEACEGWTPYVWYTAVQQRIRHLEHLPFSTSIGLKGAVACDIFIAFSSAMTLLYAQHYVYCIGLKLVLHVQHLIMTTTTTTTMLETIYSTCKPGVLSSWCSQCKSSSQNSTKRLPTLGL